MKGNEGIQAQVVDTLFEKVSVVIENARQMIVSTINTSEVYAKYEIGRYIVEDEQQGKYRAQYGKGILSALSEKLTLRYCEGWSYSNLRQIRQFYIVYSKMTASGCQIEKLESNCSKKVELQIDNHRLSKVTIPEEALSRMPKFTLSWSHYLILMRIDNPEARRFYEIECAQQQWSKRHLSRQVGSSLYERLALSRNKDEVMRLAQEGQVIEKPADIIKNPITLEFLGLKPDVAYSESKLEHAIIGKMQQFLLELGKGFLLSLAIRIWGKCRCMSTITTVS